MKKLIAFLVIMAVIIFVVWPPAPKEGFSKFREEVSKTGFDKFKEDTTKEFDEYKSKN